MPHAVTGESLQQALRDALLGQAYTVVQLGDWWALAFDDGVWLLAQRIVSPDESAIRTAISTSFVSMLGRIDAEDVPTMIAVLQSRRQAVTDIAIGIDGSLELVFANGHALLCSSDEQIVDWQWAISETGADPYSEFRVACFAKGEVVAWGAA
jgi:hypothetical protein